MRIDTPFYTARIVIGYFICLYTVSVLLSKMILTALLAANSLNKPVTLLQSLGILIDPKNLSVFDIIKTYIGDCVILLVSPILIQSSRYMKRIEKENIEKYDRSIRSHMNIHHYYYDLIAIAVIVSSIAAIFIPSMV